MKKYMLESKADSSPRANTGSERTYGGQESLETRPKLRILTSLQFRNNYNKRKKTSLSNLETYRAQRVNKK